MPFDMAKAEDLLEALGLVLFIWATRKLALDKGRVKWEKEREEGGGAEGSCPPLENKSQEDGSATTSSSKPRSPTTDMRHSMSYPRRLRLFKQWAKAMEQGATVDNPDYSRAKSGNSNRRKRRIHRKRRRRRFLVKED